MFPGPERGRPGGGAGHQCHHRRVIALDGYEPNGPDGDRPLADGHRFADEPLFWPLHLGASRIGQEAQALAFGPDWDDAQELAAEIVDIRRWPVLTVAWGTGRAIHVVYRNFPDDMGVDYLVSLDGWDRVEVLARVEGSFMGPGLSWPELEKLADRTAAGGLTDPHARLLLLFPMLGDADIPETATERLTAALATRTRAEEPEALARLLAVNQGLWPSARWRSIDGVAVCDGAYSYRDPRNDFALPIARLRQIGRALA